MVGPKKGKKYQRNSEFTGTSETSCQFMMMFSTNLIKSLSQLLYYLRCYEKYIKRTKGQTVAYDEHASLFLARNAGSYQREMFIVWNLFPISKRATSRTNEIS